MESKDDLEKYYNKVKVLLMMLLVIFFTSLESKIDFKEFDLISSPYGNYDHNLFGKQLIYDRPHNKNDSPYTVNQIVENLWIKLNGLVRELPEEKQEYYIAKVENATEQDGDVSIPIPELGIIVVIENGHLNSIKRYQVENNFKYEIPES